MQSFPKGNSDFSLAHMSVPFHECLSMKSVPSQVCEKYCPCQLIW